MRPCHVRMRSQPRHAVGARLMGAHFLRVRHPRSSPQRLHELGVGSEEAPTEGLASVRRSNWACSFPAPSFHEWVRRDPKRRYEADKASSESEPAASDRRAPDNRTVSSERDVRVFHKGNFPPSRSFLICRDCSSLDPFTNVLPRITHNPPFLVTRVVRLVLQVLLRSPTPA
jgi:hypothetical protein